MDIHLTADARDTARFFLNGKLAAEVSVGVLDSHQCLTAEVSRARHLQSLASAWERFSRATKTATTSDSEAMLRGMLAGYRGDLARHPMPGVPGMLIEDTAPYEFGWDQGDLIRRCIQGGYLVTNGPDS